MELNEKIERLKLKATILRDEKKLVFIEDIYKSYNFCEIVEIDDVKIIIRPFKGNESNKLIHKYFADILKIEEYKPKEEIENDFD